jgi:hypothetical protein
MINSCACFSHLPLHKAKQVTGIFSFSAACDISNSLQNEVQTSKKASF